MQYILCNKIYVEQFNTVINITKYVKNIRNILTAKGIMEIMQRLFYLEKSDIGQCNSADMDGPREQIAGPAIRSKRVIVYVHRCHKSSREANDRQRDRRHELAKGIRQLGLENSSTQSHVNMNLGIDWYMRKLGKFMITEVHDYQYSYISMIDDNVIRDKLQKYSSCKISHLGSIKVPIFQFSPSS